MCGLVGIVNREMQVVESEKLIKFFKQALYCDALRGTHGTGICAVDTNKNNRVFKRALNASDFLELSTANKIISDNNNVLLLGHNRWATQGAHTTENSHPFTRDHITLFHNGTLTSFFNLNKGKERFTVDSDAITQLIANEYDPCTALEQLEGAYALVWYNEQDLTLNFARNKERPLTIAITGDGKSLVYASEEGMVEWLCDRNNLIIKDIYELPVGKLTTISLEAPKLELKETSFTPKIKQEVDYKNYYVSKSGSVYTTTASNITIPGVVVDQEVEVSIDKFVKYQNTTPNSKGKYGFLVCNYTKDVSFNISGIETDKQNNFLGRKAKVKITSIVSSTNGYCTLISILDDVIMANQNDNDHPTEDDEVPFVTEVIGMVKGPRGIYISKKKYRMLTEYGCSNCSDDISEKDADNIEWDALDNVYCPTCSAHFNL